MLLNKEIRELINLGIINTQFGNDFRLYCHLTEKGQKITFDDNGDSLTDEDENNLLMFLENLWVDF